MKKSNKLLLGGFMTLVLLITAIHVTLYAKYRAGSYTVYNAEEDELPLSRQQFPNILFVSVQNVPVANVRFSDVAQVDKDKDDGLQYVQKGDTLQITGKANEENMGRHAAFYLPYNATLSFINSSVSFEGGKKTAQSNPLIYLQNARAIFPGEPGPIQFGHLRIVASDNSMVLIQGNTQADHLDVQLSNSVIETGEGNFGQLSILTDSLSRISLPAKQLLKANIKTTGTE
jgi:hypothetical protein